MPRYHFNVIDGGVHTDGQGTEFDNIRTARVEAVLYFASILRDKPEEFWADQEMQVEVTDGAGLILFTLDMSANIAPSMRSGLVPK